MLCCGLQGAHHSLWLIHFLGWVVVLGSRTSGGSTDRPCIHTSCPSSMVSSGLHPFGADLSLTLIGTTAKFLLISRLCHRATFNMCNAYLDIPHFIYMIPEAVMFANMCHNLLCYYEYTCNKHSKHMMPRARSPHHDQPSKNG